MEFCRLTENNRKIKMTSNELFVPINPSLALFSRTHFPSPTSRNFAAETNFRNQGKGQFKKLMTRLKKVSMAEAPKAESFETGENLNPPEKNLRILVAGGGIAGLVFALAAKRKGFEVVVFEKDLSAIRGEGQYRGPIQIQSNALAVLEAIDMNVAEEIMNAGCITGNRINGLVDGISGAWFIKFDTFTPAVERGLPVNRVISRMTLQQILASAVGSSAVINESEVVEFIDDGEKVTVKLENGQHYKGDVLVGADGIWSKVRRHLFGPTEAIYSGYTCYSGIADFVPADIETVGYRVFLGHKQYFVSADVGRGKIQWYAFHNEPAGGMDGQQSKKERLLQLFDGWCDNVIDLLLATDEEAILRRDIYDLNPTFTWGNGCVTLLGDSVHAMQPNFGQGGCMAIEDACQLALELDKAWTGSVLYGPPIDIVSSLRRYENARKLRVAIIHGLARMAAAMVTSYTPYLGVGRGLLSFLSKYRILHPGIVCGRLCINFAMPLMLSWALGGNGSKLEGRPLHCRLSDKASNQLHRWLKDDDALEQALEADWFLFPIGDSTICHKPIFLPKDESNPCVIGNASHSNFPGASKTVPSPKVLKMHAWIRYRNGAFYLTDLQSEHGTWITDNKGRRHRVSHNVPTRIRPSFVIEFGSDEKAMFRVKAMKFPPKTPNNKDEKQVLSI